MEISYFMIMLAVTVVTFTTSILLALAWVQNPQARCLFLWTIANLIGTMVSVLYSQRGIGTEFVTIHCANAGLTLSTGIAWAGTRAFVGRPYSWRLVATGPLLILTLGLEPAFHQSPFARTVLVSGIVALLLLAMALDLFRLRGEKLMSRYPAIICLIIHALFYLVRVAAAYSAPLVDERNMFTAPVVITAALEAMMFVIMISFLRIALVKERADSDSRRAMATDQLTGAVSRRAFFEQAAETLQKYSVPGRECTIVVFDLDHFKSINDRWGHAAGDAILQEFAARTQKALGENVLFARLGGEEFAALLPRIESKDAFFLAENVRQSIASKPFRLEDGAARLTVSIGMSFSHSSGYNLERMLRHADKALYCAKNNGRNRIECAVIEERARPRGNTTKLAA